MLSAKFAIQRSIVMDAAIEEARKIDEPVHSRFPVLDDQKDGTVLVRGNNQAIMFLCGALAARGEGGLVRVW